MEKQKFDQQLATQKEQLEIIRQKNNLHDSTLEDLAKERELEISVLRTEKERTASTRRLVAMQESNRKQMDAAAKRDSTAAKNAISRLNAMTQADAKLQEVLYSNVEARIKAEVEMEERIAEARIAAMQDGAEKVAAERNLEQKKELLQIESQRKAAVDTERKRQKEEFEAQQALVKAGGGKITEWDESMIDTTAINRINEQYQQIALLTTQKFNNAQLEQQRQNMLEYIKEYGSLQEQRLAIRKEYDEKIAKETDEWKQRSLEGERDKLLGEIDLKQLQQDINWEDVFSELDTLSVGYLETIKERLKAALSAKDITAENAQVLAEKISEIENAIGDKKDFMSAILPGLRERKRLTQETAEAETIYNKALEQQAAAVNNVLATKQQIKSELDKLDIRDALGQKIEIDLSAISEENKDNLLASLDKGSDLYKGLLKLFENLATDNANLNKKNEGTQKAKTTLDRQVEKQKGMSSLTDVFSWATGSNPLAIIQGVAQNAQSMADLSDKIGLAGTDFGDAVHGFADGVGGFNNAIQALASGDVFGAVNGALDGIAGFGRMGINALIGGGNEEEMEKEIARLSDANDNLAKAIDGLSERIGDSTATNQQSLEAYREAMKAELEWEENQRKAIDARASEYANTGYGFLGMGGKSSFNAHMAENDWSGWKTFSDILKKHLGENGIEHSSVNRNSIWNLTPEEMKLLQQFAPKEWQALMSGDGHKNPQDLVNEYIERAGMMDTLTSAFNEKLTGYSWEGFLDSYKSLLKDLTSDTEDFADKIEELISNAMLESLVNDEFQERIKKLYKYIAVHAEDGLDAGELDYIRKENESIANDMISMRETLIDAGMIKDVSNGNTSKQQTATAKSVATITYEQANALDGRMTAIQIALEQHKNNNEASYNALIAATENSGNYLSSIVTSFGFANNYLLDIRDFLKSIKGYVSDIQTDVRNLPTEIEKKL